MRKLSILIIIVIVLLAAFTLWWRNGSSAVNPQDKTQQIFVVHKGEGIREISNSLKKEGLIRDPIVFFLLIKKMGLDAKIQAGDFRLSPSQTSADIIQTLTHGTLDIWVTIPEGKRADEIADILKENIPTYKSDWRIKLENNEGYLFPDTYLIPRDADVDTIILMMKNNFEKKYESIQNIKQNNLTKDQVVIVASLIEREAKLGLDRPLVASVILNRLNIEMALQIDATIQYALGFQETEKTWWKKNLTAQDLKIDSPYNTYVNPELPPTPISNPGLDVLKAVLNPAQTNYLYYISDKSGQNHYAKTIEEHNANIRKYGL